MTYINAYDAITGESILHGQQVRACLLIHDAARLEHEHESFIPHMSRKDHKLAAFPVQGYWDGELIMAVPCNKVDLANERMLSAVFDRGDFVGAQSEIRDGGSLIVDAEIRDGGSLIAGDGSRKEYGMMIISEATFQSLKNIPRVTMFCGKYDPDRFVHEMNQLVDYYVNATHIEDRHLNIIEDIFSFKARARSFHGELDLKVPFGANFELSENRSAFSGQMMEAMKDQCFIGPGLIAHLEQYGCKPEGFDEHMAGVYEANYLSEAMVALTRTFQPSLTYSGVPNPATNIQLLVPAIKREAELLLSQQFNHVKEGREIDIEIVDDLIGKMKKDLADLVRSRNDLAKAAKLENKGGSLEP